MGNRLSLAAKLAILATSSIATCSDLHLNVTAITARNRSSVFECWALEPPIKSSNQSSVAFSVPFGDVDRVTYSVAGPHLEAGIHVAPANQWVALLGGKCVVTLPDDPSAEFVINGTKNGFFFAMDTAEISDKGHISSYTGDTISVFLQIPTVDNAVPEHTVLHSGPCGGLDYDGLDTLA